MSIALNQERKFVNVSKGKKLNGASNGKRKD